MVYGLYIERNPGRAKIVKRLEGNPYSSYDFYTSGENNLLLNVDLVYENLARNEKERQENHEAFFLENREDSIK